MPSANGAHLSFAIRHPKPRASGTYLQLKTATTSRICPTCQSMPAGVCWISRWTAERPNYGVQPIFTVYSGLLAEKFPRS